MLFFLAACFVSTVNVGCNLVLVIEGYCMIYILNWWEDCWFFVHFYQSALTSFFRTKLVFVNDLTRIGLYRGFQFYSTYLVVSYFPLFRNGEKFDGEIMLSLSSLGKSKYILLFCHELEKVVSYDDWPISMLWMITKSRSFHWGCKYIAWRCLNNTF